jgi:hypothetical protein
MKTRTKQHLQPRRKARAQSDCCVSGMVLLPGARNGNARDKSPRPLSYILMEQGASLFSSVLSRERMKGKPFVRITA